jgi:hypothetical protein
MFRSLLKSACLAAALAPLCAALATASDTVAAASYGDRSYSYGTTDNGLPIDGVPGMYNFSPAYPPISAALYPCPKPDVPHEVGRTMITNPAFAPHEMLYAHKYRALYPPYYYCNKCGLSCLPFIPKHPLRGTEVTVKYRSCRPLFGYHPPMSQVCYSNRGWPSGW